jgi:hypothetical protein
MSAAAPIAAMRSLPGIEIYGPPNPLNLFWLIVNRRANAIRMLRRSCTRATQPVRDAPMPLPNVPMKH